MSERNTPETAGWALGKQLARFVDQAEAKLRAAGKSVPERCSTCAFRAGSWPNGCVTTVMDATKCMIERVPFMCHHDKAVETPCAGYLMLRYEDPPDKAPGVAPWPFSDEIALSVQPKGEGGGDGV